MLIGLGQPSLGRPAIAGYDTLRLVPAFGTLPTQPAAYSAACQRARLRPIACTTPQAVDKDLTVADAPWRENAANNSADVYG